ncbi:MAG: hypothetical protein M3O41_06850, partial [Pseudomonadota bacterium]|nr:hypothetical protein [Pseudomonadota bacterium]
MSRVSTCGRPLRLAGWAVAALLSGYGAQAQSAAATVGGSAAATAADAGSDGLLLEEVVVTATPIPQRKFDAAYAISTMDRE